jgi:hypothetical protein
LECRWSLESPKECTSMLCIGLVSEIVYSVVAGHL